MAINIKGVWLCCKYVIAQMLKQEPLETGSRGKIVNIASVAAIIGRDCILGEGAVIERLRRSDLELDPYLVNSAFIYEDAKRAAMQTIFRQYLDIGRDYGLPLLLSTPPWRASRERIAANVSFARSALIHGANSSPLVRRRIIGLLANTAALSPEDLDDSTSLEEEDPETFGQSVAGLHRELGLKILGGCCGTDAQALYL